MQRTRRDTQDIRDHGPVVQSIVNVSDCFRIGFALQKILTPFVFNHKLNELTTLRLR